MTAPAPAPPTPDVVTGVRVALRAPGSAVPHRQRRNVLLLHGIANGAHAWNGVIGGWGPEVAVWTAELPWGLAASAEDYRSLDPAGCVASAIGQVPGGCDLVVGHSFAALALLELLSRHATDGPADSMLAGPMLADSMLAGSMLAGSMLAGSMLAGPMSAGPMSAGPMPGAAMFVAPFFRPHVSDFAWQMIAGLPGRFEATLYEGIRLYSGRPHRDDLHRDMARRVCEWIGPYGWLRFISMYLDTPRLRPDLVTLPSLVLAGGRDTTAPPAEAAALAAALPAGSLQVLPDCGHFPMVEHPAAFLDRATALLASLPPRGDLRRPPHLGD